MGHLNKGENDKFAKAIFFFLRGDPYLKAKTTTSGRRCNLGDGESLQIPCKLNLIGHQSLLIARWTLLSAVFSALSSLYRGIFGSRERKYGLYKREFAIRNVCYIKDAKLSNILGYTEKIYKNFVRVKKSEMNFCS